MGNGIYIFEQVSEHDLDTGHYRPAVKATCRICGLEETVEGAGNAAESGAESSLKARCHHDPENAKVTRTKIGTGGESWVVSYPTGWSQNFRELNGKITSQGWSRITPPSRKA